MHVAYEPAARLIEKLLDDRAVPRIWQRDPTVWGAAAGTADAKSIATRLGWLDVSDTMAPHFERLAKLAEAAKSERVEAVYLLGMGGSSLGAEVLRSVFGVADGHPELFVLDTTDEAAVTSADRRLDPQRTWFLVASKSGGTVEVASLERFFWQRMSAALGTGAGRHFIAVTDPDTALQQLARSRGYREVFLNPADIGGRFSALSLFGLVPAALIGAPLGAISSGGAAMAAGCRQENHANAGLDLGAFIGAAAAGGRDKLTLALAPSLASLGPWIEQLVAESTGKHGRGALPIVDEPLGRPDEYLGDRAFVAIATDTDAPDGQRLKALEAGGHPVLHLSTRLDGLGAEFFRWEFATAVAGVALGINPFDEPNVAEAKEKTRTLLTAFSRDGRLPEPSPIASDDAVTVYSERFSGRQPADVIRAAVGSLSPGEYCAFLSYVPAGRDVETVVDEVRSAIRAKARAATTYGVGPRYLHSTGQYHKGGPNTLLAFVITADDETQTMIPEAGYSFSVLKRAQALGDVQTLRAHGRRVVRIHVKDVSRAASAVEKLFAEALK